MNTAIVLAGGKGKRMGSDIPKQYLKVDGKEVLFYSVDAFEQCEIIDSIIIVASGDYKQYCKDMVEQYHMTKVLDVVDGGAERYDSVWSGLQMLNSDGVTFIHDGARPCVTDKIIRDCYEAAVNYKAAVAAVKVKDTIKQSDSDNFSDKTLDRTKLWQIQTPQVFDTMLVKQSYANMYLKGEFEGVTDDAMVVEKFGSKKVRLVESDYKNIKITTPEDMDIVGLFLKCRG